MNFVCYSLTALLLKKSSQLALMLQPLPSIFWQVCSEMGMFVHCFSTKVVDPILKELAFPQCTCASQLGHECQLSDAAEMLGL